MSPGGFARGGCRRRRSEIPHSCSKLQSFALVNLAEQEKNEEKQKSEEQKKGII